LRTIRLLYFFTFLLFLNCSKSKLSRDSTESKDHLRAILETALKNETPYQKRLLYTNKAKSILLKRTNDSLNRDCLVKVAKNYFYLNSWADLRTTSKTLLEKSNQKGDLFFKAQAYRWLGVYYENRSINDSAFYFYLKAEKIFKKINNEIGLCRIYLDKSKVLYYVNDYANFESSLIKSLRIAKKINLGYEEFQIYNDLGLSSHEQGDLIKAFVYYKKALNVATKNRGKFLSNAKAYCLNNMGQNYCQLGKTKEGIKVYEEALKENNLKIEDPLIYCRLLDNYGKAKLDQKKSNEIEKLFLYTSRIRDSLNIDQGKNYNKLYLSELYQVKKDIQESKKYAQEALNLSRSFHNAGDILICLKQLIKVDPQNALKYSQDYIKISDSMQQLERATRNKFAKIAYETEEITNEKEQAIKLKWIFVSLTVLLFVIGVLGVLLLIQRVKQKELRFLQVQQKTNEQIYQLIQNQQTKMDQARQVEKKRIAQDLHDGILNRLSSTRLNLHILNENATSETIKKCLPFIARIQDIEKEIRNISHDLNKDALFNKVSFVAVIEAFVSEQRSLFTGICHLEIDREINWDWLSSFQKIHIFRILQEAFQNTNKHAHANNLIISFLRSKNQLLLEIFDDGVGFSLKQKKKGIGLQNIFSRAKQCNGIADIQSAVGTGTTIRITIPLNPKL